MTLSLTGVAPAAVLGLVLFVVVRPQRRRRRDLARLRARSAGASPPSSRIGGAAVRAARGGLDAVRRAAAPRCRSSTRSPRSSCGDALGNLTPLGPLVSEPAKAAFVRGRVPLGPALTALAIENMLYTLSVAAMIAAGDGGAAR